MVSATREMSERTPASRSLVPTWPCRYLLATMLVAVMDQSLGTSTSFCSKITLPSEPVMPAVRRSHSTWSYEDWPARVKTRFTVRPVAVEVAVGRVAEEDEFGVAVGDAVAVV